MLGWHIGVYRTADRERAPLTMDSPLGTRIAVWQARWEGICWIDQLVEDGLARQLGGDGYPYRYSASIKALAPFLSSPPAARENWVYGANDIINSNWQGKTQVLKELLKICPPSETVIIEVWDES